MNNQVFQPIERAIQEIPEIMTRGYDSVPEHNTFEDGLSAAVEYLKDMLYHLKAQQILQGGFPHA